MPETRFYCHRCRTPIYNVMIDGIRVPIVHYIVSAQPDDTGPRLEVNGPGVKVTSFTRETMHDHVRTKRAELCEKCFAELFGLALVTADEDPMYSAEQTKETAAVVEAAINDATLDEVSTKTIMLERALLAVQVGRGAIAAPALPAEPILIERLPV